jgi:DNA gyrase subunit A
LTDTPTPPPSSDITPVTIEEEMKRSYLDYAMSVIVARALPDVRDGLKPVHRRILYAMQESGYDSNKPYKKSARIVGDVMGKYHPHGDKAIYDAMVRMAQDFSMRLVLIDGQGNFGSMDDDPAAAMRYTEVRLARPAEALLEDIDKDTVDFRPNYDESSQEPVVLPARFPNLLVNGAGGIAVGMATNIPTHNLGEVIAACCAYIDNPNISIDELMALVPGPDFPTGGVILGRAGIREGYHTGRGSILLRGRVHFEEIRKDREAIVVTEIPYQVNKERMVGRIGELVREKVIEGISEVRDESDREGVRVVVELKRDAMAEVVLNQLYRHTTLQTTFGVNMLALNGGRRPELMTLRQVIVAFIEFREQVIRRRTIFELGKARERAHILVGLAIAVANIDPIIALIRAAPDPGTAREQLIARAWPAESVAPLVALVDEPGQAVQADGTYRLTDAQARAILDLRLQRLTGLERDKIAEELRELADKINEYLEILDSHPRRMEIMRGELIAVRDAFATPRRTTIEDNEFEVDDEALIQREDMVLTVTHGGYVKRVPVAAYRAQHRGGKGRAAMSVRDEDFVTQVFVVSTHTPVLFFSTKGMVYRMKVYRIPVGTPQARGKALVNLLPLEEGETISTLLPLPEDEARWGEMDVMFATASGYVRRNRMSDFANIMAGGKIAMKLDEGDRLVGVQICTDANDVLLAARGGQCIRFPVSAVRVFSGRTSTGVRGIRLDEGDTVITMSILRHVDVSTAERDAYLKWASARRRAVAPEEEANVAPTAAGDEEEPESAEPDVTLSVERLAGLEAAEQFILTVASSGFGKRTSAYEYRLTNRGGSGIANIDTSARKGSVVESVAVEDTDQLMLVTDGGQLIRIPVNQIRIAGRRTQGVVLLKVGEGEQVVSVARMPEEAEGGTAAEDAGNGNENGAGNEAGPDDGPEAPEGD